MLLFSLQTKGHNYILLSITPPGMDWLEIVSGLLRRTVKAGFISAQSNGLSIYDGSRFTNYNTENGLATNLVNGVLETGDDSVFVILNSHSLQYIHNGKVRNVFLKDSLCPVINQFIKCSDGNYYAIADEGLFRFEKDHFSRIVLNGLTNINADKNLSHVTEFDSFSGDKHGTVQPGVSYSKRFIVYNYRYGKCFYRYSSSRCLLF